MMRASDPGVDGFGPAVAGADEQADQRAGQRDAGRHQEGGVHPAGERGVADVGITRASDTESPEDLAAAFDAYADAVIPALAGHWT